ncbi:MAG: hypothetical protein WCJ97_09915 [Phycisphaerae bacterium]
MKMPPEPLEQLLEDQLDANLATATGRLAHTFRQRQARSQSRWPRRSLLWIGSASIAAALVVTVFLKQLLTPVSVPTEVITQLPPAQAPYMLDATVYNPPTTPPVYFEMAGQPYQAVAVSGYRKVLMARPQQADLYQVEIPQNNVMLVRLPVN